MLNPNELPLSSFSNISSESLILQAARTGDQATISTTISSNANLEVRDNLGHTALNIAAAKGHLTIVEQLQAAGASITSSGRCVREDARGPNALSLAVSHGHKDVVGYLVKELRKTKEGEEILSANYCCDDYKEISESRNISIREYMCLPESNCGGIMMIAVVTSQNTEIVKILVDWASEKTPEFREKFFKNTFAMASALGCLDISILLYDKVSLDEKRLALLDSPVWYRESDSACKVFEYTLLRLKKEGKDEEILLGSCDVGASVDHAYFLGSYTVLSAAIEHVIQADTTMQKAWDFLLKFLSKKTVEFKNQMLGLLTTYDYAHVFRHKVENDEMNVIFSQLLKLSPTFQLKYSIPEIVCHDRTGEYAYHHRFNLPMLFHYGVYLDWDLKQKDNQNLLEKIKAPVLTDYNMDGCEDIFFENDTDILHAAVLLVDFAQEPGLDYNENGDNVVQMKAKAKAKSEIKYSSFNDLLKKLRLGLNLRRQDDGNTALHFAVLNEKENLVTLLLVAGARSDLPNRQGMTALQLGLQSQNPHIKARFCVRNLQNAFGLDMPIMPLDAQDESVKENPEEIVFENGLEETKEDHEVKSQVETKVLVERRANKHEVRIVASKMVDAKEHIEETLLALDGLEQVHITHHLMFEWGCFLAELDTPFFNPVEAYNLLVQIPKTMEQQFKIANSRIFTLLNGSHIIPSLSSKGSQKHPEKGIIPVKRWEFSAEMPKMPERLFLLIKHYLYSGLKDQCLISKMATEYAFDAGAVHPVMAKLKSLDNNAISADDILELLQQLRQATLGSQALKPDLKDQSESSALAQLKQENQRLREQHEEQATTIAQLQAALKKAQCMPVDPSVTSPLVLPSFNAGQSTAEKRKDSDNVNDENVFINTKKHKRHHGAT